MTDRIGVDMSEISVDERWLAMPGYEDCYEVSDLGRVRSVDRIVRDGRTPNGVRRLKGKIRAPSYHPFGYPQVHLSRDGESGHVLVHVAVLTAFVGPCPTGMQACHGPAGAPDPRLCNLRWDTPSANNHDRTRDGTDGQANKTRCPRKHLYAGPNLMLGRQKVKNGYGPSRECRACRRAGQSILHERRMGRPEPDFDALADAKYQKIMRAETER